MLIPETCERGQRCARCGKPEETHGNLARTQELEKRFQRSQRRRLHADSSTRLVDRVHEVGQVGHDVLAQLILVVVLADHEQSRSGDSLLQVRRDNLDTERSLDFLVVDVLTLRKAA